MSNIFCLAFISHETSRPIARRRDTNHSPPFSRPVLVPLQTVSMSNSDQNESTQTNIAMSTEEDGQEAGQKEQSIQNIDLSTSRPISLSSPSSSRPSPELIMRALNTSPRRLFLGSLSASAIALTGNFCGVTSNILDNIPEPLVENSGLDLYYPRGEFKRYKSGEFKYTFVIMKEWVQDTAVELAKIQRRSRNLDYSMPKSGGVGGSGSIPDVAYGPPGYFNAQGISQSDTNLSTIASKLRPGFSLRGSLGSPKDAAETLLRVSLAPEGSGRVATLLDAREEIRGDASQEVYTFEYIVDRGNRGLRLRAISLIAVQGSDTLITMTVVAPEKDWVGDYEAKLRKVAGSFKVTS